ncbi:MAG TPA: HAMP domain-containing sensor histidine kinase [Bacillota bacterium]|nr:HAMP domain-containing sensor histidine kinase [Bacillota bacterium]
MTGVITDRIVDYRFEQYIHTTYQARINQISTLIVDLYESRGGWKNQTFFFRPQGVMTILLKVTDNKGRTVFVPRLEHPIPPQMKMVQKSLYAKNVKIGTAFFAIPEARFIFSPQDLLFRRAITESVVIAGLLIALFTLYFAFHLAKTLTNPIRSMNRIALHITEGNLAVRAGNLPDDEIGELGKSLNQLADKLQQLEALRQKMTADVAHDLRTPLSIIRSHLEALRDQVIPPHPDNINSILEETMRLIGLVDNLQQIAQADQTIRQINKTKLNLDKLVEQIYRSMLPLFQKKQIRFIYEHQIKEAWVESDPHALRYALTNLLDNAYKYTPSNKTIQLILKENDREWLIGVADEGEGIAPADLPFIFERFYRSDRARSRETGGFGLGLTIVRDFVQALGGTIEVHSELGKGTQFFIHLPKK